jgi:acyl-CoA thioesterase-1
MPTTRAATIVLVCLVAGCGAACGDADPGAQRSAPPSSVAVDASESRPRVVALGDSLTAGLGLPLAESYPSVLQGVMTAAGYDYEVVNAGVSGDTTAGGLRRLEWVLEGDVRVLIVALGANDGLRGLSIEQMRGNLAAMIELAKSREIEVLLAGMEALPNLGAEYTTAFRGVYLDLADQYRVRLLPFLLAGVAGDPSLNQADGIHPNAEGARRVADLVWSALEPILQGGVGE